MKRILLCLMVALFATGCLFAKNNDEKMNVMSYNIRYDNLGDKDNHCLLYTSPSPRDTR
mgnify:CR=1 FL=1